LQSFRKDLSDIEVVIDDENGASDQEKDPLSASPTV
jgi:hypothetical protein